MKIEDTEKSHVTADKSLDFSVPNNENKNYY